MTIKVRVHSISSMPDLRGRARGKRIELVADIVKSFSSSDSSDEARMVQGVVSQIQNMGLLPPIQMIKRSPKLILFLTEEEYDRLGIRFEVNDVYELMLRDGTITFNRSTEGV